MVIRANELTMDEHRALAMAKNGLVVDPNMLNELRRMGLVDQKLGGWVLTLNGKMIAQSLR